MTDSHTTRRKKHQKPTAIERPRTEQLLFFFPGLESTFRPFVLHANFQFLLRKSRPYKKSSSCEYSCWTHIDGITTSLRFFTTTGRERTVPGRAPPHIRFSSCGQDHSFHYHRVHLICPQAVRCWMLGFRSCATPLGTSRRGALYIVVYLCSKIAS